MRISGLYGMVDVETLRRRGVGVREFAEELAAAGVEVVQLRDKGGSPQEVLASAAILRERLPDSVLVMNDRVDLAVIAGFDGVHVGQEDMGVADAKAVVPGTRPYLWQGREGWGNQGFIVGVSTHTEAQALAADGSGVDYVAVGPVFATGTKGDSAAVVGLEGVRRARGLTRKPLVAIGGITLENARSVFEAGADAVAVIGGMFAEGMTVEEVARAFMGMGAARTRNGNGLRGEGGVGS